MAVLGLGFIGCALLLAGLPPLSGFLAKFAMLAPLFGAGGEGVAATAWALLAALILSGLATVVAMDPGRRRRLLGLPRRRRAAGPWWWRSRR
jgi:multicomponent K+:H+ antiporter subunit D